MATVSILAASANSSSGALVSTNCRIASLSIAAYEYVIKSHLLPVVVTYVRPVISSLSLPKFGYTGPQVHVGKKVSPGCEGRALVEWTILLDSLGFILFILIRYVNKRRRPGHLLTCSVDT